MRKYILIFFIFFSCSTKEDNKSLLESLALFNYRNSKITISGTAVKGNIQKAKVNIYKLNSNGECESNSVSESFTDDRGNYEISYDKIGGLICLKVSSIQGSKMYDEATKSNLEISENSISFTHIVNENSIQSKKRTNQIIAPFSTLLLNRVQSLASTDKKTSIENIARRASKEIVIRLGLNKGLGSNKKNSSISDADYPELDELNLKLNQNNSSLEIKYLAILAGISKLASKNKKGNSITGEEISNTIQVLAEDFADGTFDGKDKNGKSISFPNGIPLGADPLANHLLPAIKEFISEGGNLGTGPNSNITINSNELNTIEFNGTTQIISVVPNNDTSTTALTSITYSPTSILINDYNSYTFTPIIAGGTPTSCTANPTLPSGLTISSACIISGTASANQTSTPYTITASNSLGSVSTIINFTITLPALVFVSTTGNDTTGNGSQGNPYATIQKGIDVANGFGTGDVRVASGIYTISTDLIMKSGVSIYGGYNPSTWVRNISANVTEIRDNRVNITTINTISASSLANPIRIDGFFINAPGNSSGNTSRFLITNTSTNITIANNTFYMADSFNSSAYAIYITGSTNHKIFNNKITLRNGTSTTRYLYGIFLSGTTSEVYNNVIYAPDSTVNGGYSVNISGNLNQKIRNNTFIFYSPGGTNYGGIYITSGTGTLNIENNIIYSSNNNGYCVYSAAVGQKPSTLANNNLFNCAAMYQEGVTSYTSGNISTAGFTTNLNFDMLSSSCFVNSTSDWHLQNSCSTSIKTGGIDGLANGWSFTTDLEGVTRTPGWSLGAYENNN